MALAYDSGNLFIKHNDKWRGDYYLKDDLSFTTNKDLAARFYLLKPGDTPILNGDRVSINSGNRTLVIGDNNKVRLLDREQHNREVNTFIITNGTDNTDPITYEGNLFIISDRVRKEALKYLWGMDLIGDSTQDVANYKPHDHPTLVNDNYGIACDAYIGAFQFQLEQCSNATNANAHNSTNSQNGVNSSMITLREESPKGSGQNFLDKYKGAVLLLLLIILLILCIMIGK